MVQKEVKKKTRIYGTVAVLYAIVLVCMVYVFGSAPLFFRHQIASGGWDENFWFYSRTQGLP